MEPSDSDDHLRMVSYVVLGLLATVGPQTSYDLKRNVGLSVGFFWSFPHSQLYSEPRRLASEGYLTAAAEQSGRRRATFAITDRGRAALARWLETEPETGEYRDPAMLRLFFTDANPATVVPLAERRIAALEAELDFLDKPGLGGTRPNPRRALCWGRAATRADLAFWRSVLEEERCEN